jgi:hypothetical protein
MPLRVIPFTTVLLLCLILVFSTLSVTLTYAQQSKKIAIIFKEIQVTSSHSYDCGDWTLYAQTKPPSPGASTISVLLWQCVREESIPIIPTRAIVHSYTGPLSLEISGINDELFGNTALGRIDLDLSNPPGIGSFLTIPSRLVQTYCSGAPFGGISCGTYETSDYKVTLEIQNCLTLGLEFALRNHTPCILATGAYYRYEPHISWTRGSGPPQPGDLEGCWWLFC